MHYLIDGNNFIGHQPGLRLGDEESRGALVQALCALARRTRATVTVVFDGPAPGPGRSQLGSVRVLYAGSADDRILRMVEEAHRASDLTVVTSDRSLSDRARSLGASTVRCHEFRPTLRDAAVLGEEKPTHVDVAAWRRFFGWDESEPD